MAEPAAGSWQRLPVSLPRILYIFCPLLSGSLPGHNGVAVDFPDTDGVCRSVNVPRGVCRRSTPTVAAIAGQLNKWSGNLRFASRRVLWKRHRANGFSFWTGKALDVSRKPKLNGVRKRAPVKASINPYEPGFQD